MVRAMVQSGPRQMEMREFARPKIGDDDALVRVEACGICGSDVEQYKGHLWREGATPSIPGHEPLGVIDEIGERAAARWDVEPGDRVAIEIIIPCHTCDLCLTGRYQACRNRRGGHGVTPIEKEPSLWGGLADYIYLHPDSIVHKMRKDIPAEIAVMFNPLGAGFRWALDYGQVGIGDSVLVLGAGQRGLAALMASKMAGAGTVFVTGLAKDAKKLALAEELGADYTINVEEENTVEKVMDLTDGVGADVVLELTPIASAPVLDAIEAVRHGGRIVLAGLKGGKKIEISTDRLINKAITAVGAFGVDATAYVQAIQAIESGRFPLEKMHTHTFELADTVQAIDTLAGDVEGEDAVHVAICPKP
ncbi:MAG: zinc-dependent alcohol dehydrogenase [Acidimicrobiales bacterium]